MNLSSKLMQTIEEEKRESLLISFEDNYARDKSNGDEERRRILLTDKQLPNSMTEAEVINTETSYSTISYDQVKKSKRIGTLKYKKS